MGIVLPGVKTNRKSSIIGIVKKDTISPAGYTTPSNEPSPDPLKPKKSFGQRKQDIRCIETAPEDF